MRAAWGKGTSLLDFRVDVARSNGCAVITVAGELDLATAPQLLEAIEEVGSSAPPRVVVNLLATSFIDSTGLTTLLRAHKRFESDNRSFALICGPENIEVLRVMDLMGFDEVFTVHPSLAAAGCDDV